MNHFNMLVEGKKENLIDKYKNELNISDFEELLSDIIELDPSATKKYSEWMIKEFIRVYKSPEYNTSSMADLIIFIGDQIKTFDELSKSITDKDIEIFLALIDSYKSNGFRYFNNPSEENRIKRSPKDIYSYPTVWTIQLMNRSILKRKDDQKQEEEHKKNVNKIYEDDRFLVVQPFTHKASCYYGASTRWCTTSKGSSREFDNYTKDGNLYYFIDKKNMGHSRFGKMALYIDNDDNYTVFDQQDNIETLYLLKERFNSLSDIIDKLILGESDYYILKSAIKNNNQKKYLKLKSKHFEKMDDEFVYLDYEDYEDLFSHIKNDYLQDSASMAISILSGYRSYNFDFYDSYNFYDDLVNGYINYVLTDEHLKIIKEILKYLGSDLVNCFHSYLTKDMEAIKKFKEKKPEDREYNDIYELRLKNDDCGPEILKYLTDIDEKFYDELSSIYSTAQNESIFEGIRTYLRSNLCSTYKSMGFIPTNDDCLSYKISISDLIKLYEKNLEVTKNLRIDELFDLYGDDMVDNFINFMEYPFEFSDSDVFDYNFDSDMTASLEKFLDRVTDSNVEDVNEFNEIYTKISNKYGFNKPIRIQTIKDNNVTIKLLNVDPEDNKINFELKRTGDNYNFRKGKAKLSTIETLITNYSLFDLFDDN